MFSTVHFSRPILNTQRTLQAASYRMPFRSVRTMLSFPQTRSLDTPRPAVYSRFEALLQPFPATAHFSKYPFTQAMQSYSAMPKRETNYRSVLSMDIDIPAIVGMPAAKVRLNNVTSAKLMQGARDRVQHLPSSEARKVLDIVHRALYSNRTKQAESTEITQSTEIMKSTEITQSTGITKSESSKSELEELALEKLLSPQELAAAGNQHIITAIEPLSGSSKGLKLVFSANNLNELKITLGRELQKQGVFPSEIDRIINTVETATTKNS